MKEWGKTFLNALLSTLPVVVIIAILHFTNVTSLSVAGGTLNGQGVPLFAIGAVFLFVGIALFSIGTDNAMSKIGRHVGASMTAHKNLIGLIVIVFLLGVFVTIAEPDLAVLSNRLFNNDVVMYYVFIGLVGLGVGVFLVIGVLRILFQKSLKVWLLAFYALLFALAILVDESFIPVAFDSGGVTTGPVTVPFIIALGVGIATSRGGKSSNADSFGLTAFCSIGPLIVVMIYGLASKQLETQYIMDPIPSAYERFLHAFLLCCRNVGIAMAPVIIFFFIYNAVVIHLPKKEILKIIVGLIYTFIGLVVFLTGVEGGFTPIADYIGQTLVDKQDLIFILYLVAALIGLVVVLCEPAVQVLGKQVEVISDGMIKKRSMMIALSIGIGIAVALAVVRVIYKFSIFYYLVPGYILALALTFVVPDIYVGVAFDSGGVASGPMTSAFILPFTLGVGHKFYEINKETLASEMSEGTFLAKQAFGTVALVAMMPLIVIQLLGLNASLMQHRSMVAARKRVMDENDNQIINFGA